MRSYGRFDRRSHGRHSTRDGADIYNRIIHPFAFFTLPVILQYIMLRIVLLLRLFAVFVAGADVGEVASLLPDAIKKIIQDDALHLYKYAESPIAPISNLTQTNDYFPTLRDALGHILRLQILTWSRSANPPVVYTMPQNQYLTLWVIRERESERSMVLIYNTAGTSCQDVGIYYHGGGQDDQVLPAREGDPGAQAIERVDGSLYVRFSINGASPEYFGRNLLLYIPLGCRLEVAEVSVVTYPEETPGAQETPFPLIQL